MSKEIVFIFRKYYWQAEDPLIIKGLFQLLPELNNFKIKFSGELSQEEKEGSIKRAKYVITPGTPSWMNFQHRDIWKLCIKYRKNLSMLGIGLAVHYLADFWYGQEDFIYLKDSGLIDLIICRDRFCYYWLSYKSGFPIEKMEVLPCPGFYVLPPKRVTDKRKVVVDLANIEETSHQTDFTFREYYKRMKYIVEELEKSKAEVFLTYQRDLNNYREFGRWIEDFFGKKLNWFPDFNSYIKFYKDKEVYIGVRNHGALSCAGSGMPSLVLGVDYRQYIIDEVPFIAKLDISYANWQPFFILDWYHSLDPTGISNCLLNWRELTFRSWREKTKIVLDRLC